MTAMTSLEGAKPMMADMATEWAHADGGSAAVGSRRRGGKGGGEADEDEDQDFGGRRRTGLMKRGSPAGGLTAMTATQSQLAKPLWGMPIPVVPRREGARAALRERFQRLQDACLSIIKVQYVRKTHQQTGFQQKLRHGTQSLSSATQIGDMAHDV